VFRTRYIRDKFFGTRNEIRDPSVHWFSLYTENMKILFISNEEVSALPRSLILCSIVLE
jgi:hypothetical protein